MMKKYMLIIVVFIVVLAMLTVPSKQDYVEWIKGEIKQESNNSLVNLGVNLLGSLLIENSSTCKNYIVVTVCSTNILETKEVTAVGLFNKFFSSKLSSQLLN